MVEILVNGERRKLDQALCLTHVIEQLGLSGKRIAIERNGEIVPRSQFSATPVGDGDTLEIVVAVGGG
jgi:sulfur carrier protein